VLLGPAGCGRSSLAAALAGLLPAEGRASVDGRRLTGTPAQRRQAGLAVMLPDIDAPRGVSVEEALGLAAQGRPRPLLERLPLLAERRRLPAALLSGGERMVLRLGCALARQPRALVLDSPTAGLAADVADRVVEIIAEEAKRGCAVLWLDRDGAPTPSGGQALRVADGRIEPMATA